MVFKKLTIKKVLVGSVLGAMLSTSIIVGCTADNESGEGSEGHNESRGKRGNLPGRGLRRARVRWRGYWRRSGRGH